MSLFYKKLKYRTYLKLSTAFPSLFPDAIFLKAYYFLNMGKELNLRNPVTYSEKLQWLKIHNRKDKYTLMVDKYLVKQYVADLIGHEYIIPTIGVWDSADKIDFNLLPDTFVLKCNHDSGNVIICKDKEQLNIPKVKQILNAAINSNFYLRGREWPYKNVNRKIMAEQLLTVPDEPFYNHSGMTDFKFSCFNGVVNDVMVCLERESEDTKFYFFSKNWELLRYNIRGKNAPSDFTIPRPKNFNKMIEIAEILSKDIPYLRVDLYNLDGEIFFGEMTFFPQSGIDSNILPETEIMYGNLIKLPVIK